jgi:hypothetical protein
MVCARVSILPFGTIPQYEKIGSLLYRLGFPENVASAPEV